MSENMGCPSGHSVVYLRFVPKMALSCCAFYKHIAKMLYTIDKIFSTQF